MKIHHKFSVPTLKSTLAIVSAVTALLLAGCSSSDSTTPESVPVAGDPAFVEPGERPIIRTDVVTLTPEEFEAPAGSTQNMLEVMEAAGTFTRLLALIEQAGLNDALADDDTLTIFAPTDDAFVELDAAVSSGLLAALSVEELDDRLTYHTVVGNALSSTDLRGFDGRALDMANGLPAAINIDNDGQLKINGSVLLTSDLIASNGVLHVIGSVLTPPLRAVDPNTNIPPATTEDISTTLLRRSDYSTLLLLIEQAGLAEQLQEDNNGLGWTLFAPSDMAFDGVDLSAVESVEAARLVELHLLPQSLSTEELPDGILQMKQGSVVVSRTGGVLTVGGATVVGRDRVVGNGVIHFVGSLLSADVN